MAAATVTSLQQDAVLGNLRRKGAGSIAFAASGDTWATGLKVIRGIDLTPTTNDSYGFTVSGGTLTLASGGAVTFRGGVLGL